MGLLTATLDDTKPRGETLPGGTYRVTVESVGPRAKGNGTELSRQYGSIRTRDGATEFPKADGNMFRIGNRKLFAGDWIDHSNPDAVKVGHSRLTQEAIAAGLMPKPTKEQPESDLPYENWDAYGAALVGRELLVIVGPRSYVNKAGETVTDVEVKGWVLP